MILDKNPARAISFVLLQGKTKVKLEFRVDLSVLNCFPRSPAKVIYRSDSVLLQEEIQIRSNLHSVALWVLNRSTFLYKF